MKKKIVILMLAGVLSTAIINSKVIEMPTEVNAEESFQNIGNGDNGDQVKEIQSFLKSAGYLDGEADGSFGNMTENAVKNFQKDNGLEETGIVDRDTFEKLKEKGVPEGLIVDEDQWKNWTAINNPSVLVFLDGCELAGCDIGLKGEQQQNHKEGTFYFKDDGASSSLDGAGVYYGVESQQVNYAGLSTSEEYIYNSDRFKDACKRLMRGYASYVNKDASNSKDTLNVENSITEERASEIVDYCFDAGIEHCLVDNMRIRLIRSDTDGGYYSFHIEYSMDNKSEKKKDKVKKIYKSKGEHLSVSSEDDLKWLRDLTDKGMDTTLTTLELTDEYIYSDEDDYIRYRFLGSLGGYNGSFEIIYDKKFDTCEAVFYYDTSDLDSVRKNLVDIFNRRSDVFSASLAANAPDTDYWNVNGIDSSDGWFHLDCYNNKTIIFTIS